MSDRRDKKAGKIAIGVEEMECCDDQSDRNSLRSVWRCRSGETPSRNSVASKDADVEQSVGHTMRRTGASRRTRRADADLSALMNSRFFFQENNAGDSAAGSESPNSEEANKHGRMMEWLEMQISSSPDSLVDSYSTRRLSAQNVATVSPTQLPRPKIPRSPLTAQDRANASSPTLPRPKTPSYSNSPSPLNPNFSSSKSSPLDCPPIHRRSPSYRCNLPCQSCGSTHEILSQDRLSSASPSTGEALSVIYKRNDRLSKSARHPEMAVETLPASSGVKKEPSPLSQAPVAMYPKFDRFSKSARHPEMAANLVLSGYLNASDRNNDDMSGNPQVHKRSTSVDISKSDNRSWRVDDHAVLPGESNQIRKKNIPRMIHSASSREQIGSLKGKPGGNDYLGYNRSGSETKSPASTMQHWLAQLLRKTPKGGPKVSPVKNEMPVHQKKSKDSVEGAKLSRNRSSVTDNNGIVKPQSEQQVVGVTTLTDVLNTNGVNLMGRKALSIAPQDYRSVNASNDSSQETLPAMHLPRSGSIHSGQLCYTSPVQDRTLVPSSASLQSNPVLSPLEDRASRIPFSAPVSLNSNGSKQHPKINDRLLSPPNRRKEAARRLEMLVKENERHNSHSNSSENSSPLSSIQKHLKLEVGQEKLEGARPKLRYEVEELNQFLQKQRKGVNQEEQSDIQIMAILSGPGLSSMVAAISYAWILENVTSERPDGWMHVPVLNFPRRNMWRNEQAAWLFHQCRLDAKTLLFSDEVDLEKLANTQKNKIVTIGRDVFRTNREVASCCTLLVEKYFQDAQSVLKGGIIKKLLLAGVLLDTENLDFSSAFCTARDEAVAALLLHGAGPNGRYGFYLQLKRQFYDRSFRTILRGTYGEIGECPVTEVIPEDEESKRNNGAGKTQKQVNPDSGRTMAIIMKEKGSTGILVSSGNSGISTTMTVNTTPFSRPKLASSNWQHEVYQPGSGSKSIETIAKAKTAGGWKAMNRNSVARFFNVFGRTRNTH